MNTKASGSPLKGKIPSSVVVAALLMLLFLVLTGVSNRLVSDKQQVVPTGLEPVEAAPAEALPVSETWAKRTLKDIAVEAPMEFSPDPGISAALPRNIRDTVESFESYEGRHGNSVMVYISRVAYKPGVEVSLEGAVQGAMTRAASSAGDAAPRYESVVTSVGGLEARRATYSGQVAGGAVLVEGLFIHEGSRLWQVIVVHPGGEHAETADRILQSVQVSP